MPAFLIRYRLPSSPSVHTDEIITPSGWTQTQASNHFTAAFCSSATVLDCWQEDPVTADIFSDIQPVLPQAAP